MKENSKKQLKRYSEELKREALELAKKNSNSAAAKSLGINEANIRQWSAKSIRQAQSDEQKSYSDLERENRRLAKEISYLKEISNIFKKSTAIFSVDQLGNLK